MTVSLRSTRLCILLAFLFLGFGCADKAVQVIAIPGAATRTPDFHLPLSPEDRDLALVFLNGGRPPQGRWERWGNEEVQEELETVARAIKETFAPVLISLSSTIPDDDQLGPKGRVGSLFEPEGTTGEGMDTRMQGEVLSGDIQVGSLSSHYFAFYRRFPSLVQDPCRLTDAACAEGYCVLVIFSEVAVRKN